MDRSLEITNLIAETVKRPVTRKLIGTLMVFEPLLTITLALMTHLERFPHLSPSSTRPLFITLLVLSGVIFVFQTILTGLMRRHSRSNPAFASKMPFLLRARKMALLPVVHLLIVLWSLSWLLNYHPDLFGVSLLCYFLLEQIVYSIHFGVQGSHQHKIQMERR